MPDFHVLFELGTILLWLIHLGFIGRAILRPHREPASRVAWVVVMVALPVIGIAAYVLLGDTNIGRRRVDSGLQGPGAASGPGPNPREPVPGSPFGHGDRLRTPVPGRPLGERLRASRRQPGAPAHRLQREHRCIVADIEAATDHVHLLFYIWLPDNNGSEGRRSALPGGRAPGILPGNGRRPRLPHDDRLRALEGHAGCRGACRHGPAHRESPVPGPAGAHRPAQPPQARGDRQPHHLLRQPELRRPRVPGQGQVCALGGRDDALRRPIAGRNQCLFASDWIRRRRRRSPAISGEPLAPCPSGVTAQVIGTGPTMRHSAMPEVFENLMFAPDGNCSSPRRITFRMSPCRPRSAPARAEEWPPRSSFRRATTHGSSARPAAATTRSFSTPGSASSSTRRGSCTPSP